ncbi:hypothetical protein K439DRAFT_1628095 [Ramaria rubella]|nr:hypothetical protein K439DRAFT_1628095 [Ramaria rubella]
MGSISTLDPMSQQFYAMHTPKPFVETLGSISTIEPFALGGSNDLGTDMWPDMYEQNWYVHPIVTLLCRISPCLSSALHIDLSLAVVSSAAAIPTKEGVNVAGRL